MKFVLTSFSCESLVCLCVFVCMQFRLTGDGNGMWAQQTLQTKCAGPPAASCSWLFNPRPPLLHLLSSSSLPQHVWFFLSAALPPLLRSPPLATVSPGALTSSLHVFTALCLQIKANSALRVWELSSLPKARKGRNESRSWKTKLAWKGWTLRIADVCVLACAR